MILHKETFFSKLSRHCSTFSAIEWVMLVLTGLLLVILLTPQAVSRDFTHSINVFSYTYLNHALILHITEIGDAVLAGTIGIALTTSRSDLLKRVLFIIILSALLSNLLKGYFDYPRPPAVFGTETVIGPAHRTRSFPSGHTLTAFVMCGFLWQVIANKIIRTVTLALAACVGLSRIQLGVHWLTDVFFGAWLGWAIVILSGMLFPSKHDADTSTMLRINRLNSKRLKAFSLWLTRPFSNQVNQVLFITFGILIVLTIAQKPSEMFSVEFQRQLIGLGWVAVISLQTYYLITEGYLALNEAKRTKQNKPKLH